MLKEIDQTTKFMTVIKADFRDADFIYKHTTFPNKDLKKIIAFLIITQEVYNKAEELCKFTNEKDISTDLIECIELYFEKYANCKLQDISKYGEHMLDEPLWDILPEVIKLEPYRYPRYINEILIVKNGKTYEFEKTQSESNIKNAQKYILDMIRNYKPRW